MKLMSDMDISENKYIERVRKFKSDPAVHYNCAQAVILAFSEEAGLDEEQAVALGAHFGGGMRMGSVCGAISGGAMVLGLLRASDKQYREFLQAMKEWQSGAVDCSELLRKNAEAGGSRKDFCDGLIIMAVDTICRVTGMPV